MMHKKSIWLDCDPGHDDAMAIILAAMDQRSELIGITTVAGNQSSDKTYLNALSVLRAIKREDVPVFKGQSRAILGPMPYCEEIHGRTGLDGLDGNPLFPLPDPVPAEGFWLLLWKDLLVQTAVSSGQKVDLVCTASLTNVALLITLFPEVRDAIQITIMGGSVGIGNTGPVAEFNIENDPEAAHIVFESGIPLVMVPLEVTHTLLADAAVISQIGNDTPFNKKICDLLGFFRGTYKNVFGFNDPPLHDPAAVFYVLDPDAFEIRDIRVDIERASELGRGQTVCDVYGRRKKPANCKLAVSVNVPLFWKHMVAAVHSVSA